MTPEQERDVAALRAREVDSGLTIDRSAGELPTFFSSNEDAFRAIMALYARPGWRVADVTYGHGTFWSKIPSGEFDLVPTDLAKDKVDLRELPYGDASFDVHVLDPPYRYAPKKSNVLEGYDESYEFVASAAAIHRVQDVQALYEAGMREAARVLRRGGFCVLKCQDTIQDGKQYWLHIRLMEAAERLGFGVKDLVVVAAGATPPPSRWRQQKHLRKAHSYFLVLRNGGLYPFGAVSTQRRSKNGRVT